MAKTHTLFKKVNPHTDAVLHNLINKDIQEDQELGRDVSEMILYRTQIALGNVTNYNHPYQTHVQFKTENNQDAIRYSLSGIFGLPTREFIQDGFTYSVFRMPVK